MPRDSEDRLGLQATQVGALTADENLYGPVLGAGAQVGAYVIEEFHSRGGFGSIYRGRHALTGALAAVKLLHQHLASSPSIVSRFHRESEAVGRVHHENVVELLEYGQLGDGRPYLVMEWLEGRSLETELLECGAMPFATAIGLLEQLCAGLGAAHACGIVHRDLKASNVVLVDGAEGKRLKLVDFGIAKILGDEELTRLTRTGIRLGTPAYMAPEQIVGREVTPQTDIYALGVLLYHMLTGQLPFGGRTAIEVEDHHLHTPPPRASDVAELHGTVDDVILRCLAKEPLMRFPSVQDLSAALHDCVTGHERPSRRFRAAGGMAVGLYVAAPAQLSERAAGECLDSARRLVTEQGLVPVYETERALLAIASREGGRPLTAVARQLLDAARVTITLPCEVTVHIGTVQMLVIDGVVQFVGGELLVPDAWASRTLGILATQAAVEHRD